MTSLSIPKLMTRPQKDCRVCNRRRIRCDRGMPECLKCQKKGLPCPGYGLQLRWGQGVASRGKLAGKSLPILDLSHSNLEEPKKQDLSNFHPPASSISFQNISGSSTQTITPSGSKEDTVGNVPKLSSTVSLSNLPPFLRDESARSLVHYFDDVVAATMPWVDGPNNAWRTQIVPLSMTSHSLLLAVLALAAEHLQARMGPEWISENGLTSRNYRDKSLQLLAQELRKETTPSDQAVRNGNSNATLATILALCHLEMVQSNSNLWRLHWRAARTIINTWTTASNFPDQMDATSRFLIDEAFVIDVFASTTTFDDEAEIPGSVLTDEDYNVFTEYLQIVQELTRHERVRHKASKLSNSNTATKHEANNFEDRFEHARQRSVYFAKSINFEPPSLSLEFAKIIEAYHYAGLIYGYQTIANLAETYVHRARYLMALFEEIEGIDDKQVFQQDLVWPLFIAGTESRGHTDQQQFIETHLSNVMRTTGFSNCEQVLLFLQRLWKTHLPENSTWISFARYEAEQGISFLVL